VHWHTETIRNLSQTLVEYLTEEQPLLAKPIDMHELIREINALQDDAAQLEERVKALAARRT
jgi:ubiquinone biosynthesis protein UbiJ